jgi:hypothetical protein
LPRNQYCDSAAAAADDDDVWKSWKCTSSERLILKHNKIGCQTCMKGNFYYKAIVKLLPKGTFIARQYHVRAAAQQTADVFASLKAEIWMGNASFKGRREV